MLAEEVLAKLKDGAAFAEMASVYSQGSQRKPGRRLGWVEKSVLRRELADVAFGLKPGEKSDVIETRKPAISCWSRTGARSTSNP